MFVMQLIAVAAINDATHLGNLGALSASRAGQHMGRKVDGFVDRRIHAAHDSFGNTRDFRGSGSAPPIAWNSRGKTTFDPFSNEGGRDGLEPR